MYYSRCGSLCLAGSDLPLYLCRCYQPMQSRAAGDMAVLVGIGVGESDVHSNVVYFKDPRPGAGTLEVQGITLCVVYV